MSAPQASKGDLIATIARENDVGKATAELWIDLVLGSITALAVGQKLIIRGFGTFEVKNKLARTARNIRTGLPVEVPARSVLTFKAAKAKA